MSQLPKGATAKKTAKQQQAAILPVCSVDQIQCIAISGFGLNSRGIESMLLWCCMFDSDNECMDTMGGFGKERNNNIAEAKKNGTAYEPEAPIHVIMWIGVLEI